MTRKQGENEMKFINDCDSTLPIEINLPYLNKKNIYDFNQDNLKIVKKTIDLDDKKIYDLVIIGGGLAGVSFAARANQMNLTNIAIIDEKPSLMNSFISRTKNINQKLMRSSYKHHLGPVEQISLADFARINYNKLVSGERRMLEQDRKGERAIPSLDTFIQHSTHVIKANNILNNTYNGKVIKIEKHNDNWVVNTNSKVIKTKRVILATGNILKDETSVQKYSIPTFSAFEDNSASYLNTNIDTVCVNGSGNTSAHLVYNALVKGKKVHWILRSELVYRCADIPNEYWRTEGILSYQKLSLEKRMENLADIYHGSAMPEHKDIFRKFIKRNMLIIHEHTTIESEQDNEFKLSNGLTIKPDIIINSFGLKPSTLPEMPKNLNMYMGFPILNDNTLMWDENLYVGSSLAALSLGPSAKNIDGMRLSIERIFNDIKNKTEGNSKRDTNNLLLKNRNQWGTFGPIGKIKRGRIYNEPVKVD